MVHSTTPATFLRFKISQNEKFKREHKSDVSLLQAKSEKKKLGELSATDNHVFLLWKGEQNAGEQLGANPQRPLQQNQESLAVAWVGVLATEMADASQQLDHAEGMDRALPGKHQGTAGLRCPAARVSCRWTVVVVPNCRAAWFHPRSR